MGFKKVPTANGAAGILWDLEKIERMKEAYGLNKTSVLSERSVTQAHKNHNTDDPDVSDVSQRLL